MDVKKHYGLVCIKGMAMGAADVVPGVSGGTIAFIVGIYEELLDSIRSFSPATVRLLFQEGPAVFWKAINGNFLVSLVTGILISILSLARAITYLLDHQPILIWSFFFGLIFSSIIYMARQITKLEMGVVISGLIGTVIAYTVSISPPTQAPDNLWFVFLSGAIAICAMILPGISGSFILLLLGLYSFILNALKSFDLVVITVFVSGCIVGLLSFSHFLGWLLKNYKDITIALLTGFLVGSLNVVWPWKYVTESFINRHGKSVALSYDRVSPNQYEVLTQASSQWMLAIAFMLFGFALVFLLEYFAKVKE